jgi:hypothetical protein
MIRVLRSLYRTRTAELTMEGETKTININGGSGQGMILAPRIFSLYLHAIFELWLQDNPEALLQMKYNLEGPLTGQKWNETGSYLHYCLFNFADDTALICDSKANVQAHGFSLIRLLRDFGLDVHMSTDANPQPKTASMCVPTRATERQNHFWQIRRKKSTCNYNTPAPPQLTGSILTRHAKARMESKRVADDCNEPVEILPYDKFSYVPVVKNYTYVGSNVSHTLTDDYEVLRKLKSASCMLGLLRRRILGPRTTSYEVKKTVYTGMILGVLLYGAESWILTKPTERLLQNFHRRAARTMCSINLWHTQKYSITAASLDSRLGIGTMRDALDKRLLGWVGHMARMHTHRWPLQLLHSFVENPRLVGAPPKTFGKQLKEALKRKNVDLKTWKALAMDRSAWRTMINTPSKLNTRTKQNIRIGCSIQGMTSSHMEAQIVRKIMDDNVPAWEVRFEDDSTCIISTQHLLKRLIPHQDKLNKATTMLADPTIVMGKAITKKFNNQWYCGLVTNYDTDSATGETIWEVSYQDGDIEDHNVPELLPLLDSSTTSSRNKTTKLRETQSNLLLSELLETWVIKNTISSNAKPNQS